MFDHWAAILSFSALFLSVTTFVWHYRRIKRQEREDHEWIVRQLQTRQITSPISSFDLTYEIVRENGRVEDASVQRMDVPVDSLDLNEHGISWAGLHPAVAAQSLRSPSRRGRPPVVVPSTGELIERLQRDFAETRINAGNIDFGTQTTRGTVPTMPRPVTLVTEAPSSTSNVRRTATAAERLMAESAADYLASKMVTVFNRDSIIEQEMARNARINGDAYIALLTELSTANDSAFPSFVERVQVLHGTMSRNAVQMNTYFSTARVNRAGETSVAPDYLTRGFLRDTIIGLCSSYEGFEWNANQKTLTVHTEYITLRATIRGTAYTVPMGRYKIVWNATSFNGSNGRPDQFKILSLDNMHAENSPSTIHPHVLNNNMCPGNNITGVQVSLPNALNGGHIADAFDLVDGLLHNYGPSPYTHLENWGNHACPGCNRSVASRGMKHCFQCDASHCISCSQECGDCGRWFCKERCGTMVRNAETGARSYECPCVRNTVRCSGCEQRFDPETPAGNLDPGTGYCPRCLYQWLNGVRPTPATRPAGTTATTTPVTARPVPQPAPPAIAPTRPPAPVPGTPSRARHGQFDGTFDDLLDGQETLLQTRLNHVVSMEADLAVSARPVTDEEQTAQLAVDRALAMLDDIDGVRRPDPIMEAPFLDLTSVQGVEPLSITERVNRMLQNTNVAPVAEAASPDAAVVPVPEVEVPLTTSVGNNNRYRDPLSGRWVTR